MYYCVRGAGSAGLLSVIPSPPTSLNLPSLTTSPAAATNSRQLLLQQNLCFENSSNYLATDLCAQLAQQPTLHATHPPFISPATTASTTLQAPTLALPTLPALPALQVDDGTLYITANKSFSAHKWVAGGGRWGRQPWAAATAAAAYSGRCIQCLADSQSSCRADQDDVVASTGASKGQPRAAVACSSPWTCGHCYQCM